MKNTWAILVAGGKGKRFGSASPKQFLSLGAKPLLEYSLEVLAKLKIFEGIVLVLPEEHVKEWKEKLNGNFSYPVKVVPGGATRQQSVTHGLKEVDSGAQWVLIHDGARPLVTKEIVERTLDGARETGAAVTALPVADTLKEGDAKKTVIKTIPREGLFQIQTPQVFAKKILEEALEWARENSFDATDEATLVEKMGGEVRLVEGSRHNIKVTQPQDLAFAELLIKGEKRGNMASQVRIGQGYDVHPFVDGRDLVLGGVTIPFEKGLQGHSDADALLHAISDALLGAAALGDLGAYFPDSDPKYKGISSLKILGEVAGILEKKGFQVSNVDATLVCQRPKLAPHVPQMRENIARELKVSMEQVSVKATTEEGLGFTGTMEGLAAKAVVLIQGIDKD